MKYVAYHSAIRRELSDGQKQYIDNVGLATRKTSNVKEILLPLSSYSRENADKLE